MLIVLISHYYLKLDPLCEHSVEISFYFVFLHIPVSVLELAYFPLLMDEIFSDFVRKYI